MECRPVGFPLGCPLFGIHYLPQRLRFLLAGENDEEQEAEYAGNSNFHREHVV
jgi:hypothetical protein